MADPLDGEAERGEVWTADRVELRLLRPAWLRTLAGTVLGLVLVLGITVAVGLLLMHGGLLLVAVALGFALIWLALVGATTVWLQLPIAVSAGPDQLVIAGESFARQELVRVRREGARFVVTVRGRPDWRSPQVEPVDPDRLLAILRGAVPTPAQVEADRLEEARAVKALEGLREREPVSR